MESLTKRRLTRAQIEGIFRTALGDDVEITDITEFTDGWFAGVYGVSLADGRDLVLKAAPDPALKLLRYEVDLAHTEIEYYRRAAEVGTPIPTLHHSDPDAGYLVMDRLKGQSLAHIKDTLTQPQLVDIRRQLGGVVARLHTMSSATFGYPRRDGHTRSTSWRTSFLTFIDDILADAVEYERDLPRPAEEISALIRRHAAVLDEVTVPALVHFDMWDGNVFIRPDGDGYVIDGIIDGERAFYGDPIADFICLEAVDNPLVAPYVSEGYFGAERQFTESERLRLRLYTSYLDLIMVTEGAVRGFDPAEHGEIYRTVFQNLEENLAQL